MQETLDTLVSNVIVSCSSAAGRKLAIMLREIQVIIKNKSGDVRCPVARAFDALCKLDERGWYDLVRQSLRWNAERCHVVVLLLTAAVSNTVGYRV